MFLDKEYWLIGYYNEPTVLEFEKYFLKLINLNINDY